MNFPVVIWHNPACGTSRRTLGLIREAGYEPEVVEYVQAGWTRDALATLLAEAGLTPGQALRESEARALGVQPDAEPASILDAMVAHPALVQRPLVRTPRGAVLARPPERALELLEPVPPSP
ncbi:MAG: arsenate reductase family protein [Proteobacteria bacterium]|nr:arsenate reductase family protein [Pseudomonadota bacterium]